MRPSLITSLLVSFGLLSFGCTAVEDQSTDYDQLAELVAEHAGLDDWDICAADGATDVDAPSCEEPAESYDPASSPAGLQAPEGGPQHQTTAISCNGDCCLFTDPTPEVGVTLCCKEEVGPATCWEI